MRERTRTRPRAAQNFLALGFVAAKLRTHAQLGGQIQIRLAAFGGFD
jgi:hypothetical protein